MGSAAGPLLIGALMLLVGCGAAAFLLLRTTDEERALAARIEAVASEGKPKRAQAITSITRKDQDQQGWQESLTQVFGFSLQRADHYPLAWYWVLLIAAGVGRLAVLMASGLFGLLAWVVLPVAMVAVSRAMFGSMSSKRTNRLRAQLPDALGLIVRSIRVGVPVTQALLTVSRESMAPTRGEFERLANQISIGTPLEVALRETAKRNALPEYGFLAAALSLQAQTGGGLGETLELLADVTRKRVAMQARGHALSAEARTSSMILGGLPVAAGLGLYAVNPDYIGMLFWDETGRMVLGLAVLSLSIGMFVMRMIIRKSLAV